MLAVSGRLAAAYPYLAIVLAGANALLFALSLHYLRLLGEYEMEVSNQFSYNVDLVGLYDFVPNPRLVRLASTEPSLDKNQSSGTVIPASIEQSRVPTLKESLPVVTLRVEGTTQSEDESSLRLACPQLPCSLPKLPTPPQTFMHQCGICQGPVRGLLPTTARVDFLAETQKANREAGCKFVKYEGAFLGEFVDNLEVTRLLAETMLLCETYGNACRGVVCDRSDLGCTMRSGSELRASTTETAYVKRCPELALSLTKSDDDCSEAPVGKLNVNAPVQPELLSGAAIVIIAHNRAVELRKCLRSLLTLKDISLFHLYVSVDITDKASMMEAIVVEESKHSNTKVEVWFVPERPVPLNASIQLRTWFSDYNTAKIAWHYWNAFEKVFTTLKHEYAILVEEDLVFSPDFVSFFRSTAGLLQSDSSVWCVSAWNDNSLPGVSEDRCRLKRTSYFPGLGFLLPRVAWTTLRTWWTQSPTMGWDYWMRVAFRRAGKECIIPEVSRTRHIAEQGSSVSNAKMVEYFKQMTFSEIPTTCEVQGPCHQFGDVSYLIKDRYEATLRATITQAPRVTELNVVRSGELVVFPFKYDEVGRMMLQIGLRFSAYKDVIPKDLRGEHFGVVSGRYPGGVSVLAVDRRSVGRYLRPEETLSRHPSMKPVAATVGASCHEACSAMHLNCDVEQMPFLNDCNEMLIHFPCEDGCAHQVGAELPAYVSDRSEPTYQQCLVTFISSLNCEGKHPSTNRLCACMPESMR